MPTYSLNFSLLVSQMGGKEIRKGIKDKLRNDKRGRDSETWTV